MSTKYHVEQYEQENGETVWFTATINGDMATGEQYATKLEAECELIQLQQAERDIEYIEKKNQSGESILPAILWLVATLLLAMLFIVPTARHYDRQINAFIESNTTPANWTR